MAGGDMSKKILVVDDEEGVANLLKSCLESQSYTVDVAKDGEVGLSMAKTGEYDLILLDLGLPKRDGQSVCLELKLDDKFKDIPIIMLTGRNIEKEKEIGQTIGADEYIGKPFDLKQLIATINKFLA